MVKFTSKQKQSKGMKKMIVENKKIEKACSFYVSDFHLEMILMPYINKKINNNEEIAISTEKDLRETVEILISKMNINEGNKEKILNLGWNRSENVQIEKSSNVIVIGTEEYIKKINEKIEDSKPERMNIINCYNFEDVKDNVDQIISLHNESLNTIGFNKF